MSEDMHHPSDILQWDGNKMPNREDLLREIFRIDTPERVPESILDGSMTLKQFHYWASKATGVQLRDDVVIRGWLAPYIRLVLGKERHGVT